MKVHHRRWLVVVLLGVLVGAFSAGRQFFPVLLDREPQLTGLVMAGATLASFLLSPVGMFLAGYWIGTDVDVSADWLRLILTIGSLGALGVFVSYLVVIVSLDADSVVGLERLDFVLYAVYYAIVRFTGFGVTGFAGAAVAEFRGR
ncbi:hypothetical protein HUG10_02780 [Halorarum halophilum]|uniref:Uncharacterized protein n=1 Tax=Halorarum halophilum TaxID=2743090 RepID=A0A7D5GVZ5_9EURY|nr:hypothetical protein [Halobaculum halophilum]QLG26529.1 hypothetical protein HUG10_02780 [Halobaculum halophilum]